MHRLLLLGQVMSYESYLLHKTRGVTGKEEKSLMNEIYDLIL